jgi:hypothetical protein
MHEICKKKCKKYARNMQEICINMIMICKNV